MDSVYQPHLIVDRVGGNARLLQWIELENVANIVALKLIIPVNQNFKHSITTATTTSHATSQSVI